MSAAATSRSQLRLATPTPSGEKPTYRHLAQIVGAAMRAAVDELWDDAVAVPPSGGVLIVSNHVSYADVLAVGRYLIWSGRWPRYLGKAELWRLPLIGWLAQRCRQIPVERGTDRAKDALITARQALISGECVAIYPEGGRTYDPDLWPQRARTGAARLALDTGVPVIPVVQWGSHRVMPGRRMTFPRLWPRRTIQVVSGAPVDLADLGERPRNTEVLQIATARIMEAITVLVEELRGQPRPAEGVWEPQEGRRVPDRWASS